MFPLLKRKGIYLPGGVLGGSYVGTGGWYKDMVQWYEDLVQWYGTMVRRFGTMVQYNDIVQGRSTDRWYG